MNCTNILKVAIPIVYENDTIKAYANEMPLELRKVIDALNNDMGMAAFLVLYKYGEMPFSEIMERLGIPQKYSSRLTYHLKKLQKSALVKNVYVKKKSAGTYSYYDVTEFGETVLENLINILKIGD